MESAFFILFIQYIKYKKHLIKQTWPYRDKCVALYRALLPKGLDLFCLFVSGSGGRGWALLVGYSFIFANLVEGFLSLKYTITQSLRGQIAFGGNLEN